MKNEALIFFFLAFVPHKLKLIEKAKTVERKRISCPSNFGKAKSKSWRREKKFNYKKNKGPQLKKVPCILHKIFSQTKKIS